MLAFIGFVIGVLLFVCYEYVKSVLDEIFFSSSSVFNSNKLTQIIRYCIYAPVQVVIWSLMATTFCVSWAVVDTFSGVIDDRIGTSVVVTERETYDLSEKTQDLYKERYGKSLKFVNIKEINDSDIKNLSESSNGPYCIYTKPGMCGEKINNHYFYPASYGLFQFALPDGNHYIIGDATDHFIRAYFLPSPAFDVVDGKMVTTKTKGLGEYWIEWAGVFIAWYVIAFFFRIFFGSERYFPQTA